MTLRPVAVAAATSAALLLSGCGSTSTSPGSAPIAPGSSRFLAAAATKSTGTPSMKTEVTVTMLSSKLPGGRMDMTANGTLDNTNHRMDMRLDMSKFVAGLGAGAAALGSPSDWVGEEVGDFGGGRAVLYMRLPVLTKLLSGGKPWIKVDLGEVGKRAGIDISQFTQFAGDPTRMVDWLRAAGGSVTTVGTETVDGEPTTHYKATIDIDKYPSLVAADQRDLMRKAVDSIKQATHLSSFPMHVWVGKDGLVRQVRTVLTETIQGQTVNVVTSERFFDFGAPVDIVLPSDDQVTDISNLGTGG
ncbi:MAG: hypothetical protein ACM3QU_03535 [Verrucomicrobiota bacterium]